MRKAAMPDEVKVPETPKVPEELAPKSLEGESAQVQDALIDKSRQQMEAEVEKFNSTPVEPESEIESEVTEQPKAEEDTKKPEEKSPVDRIKEKVQKRIDKVVSEKKSLEEEVESLRQELSRLKAEPKSLDPSKEDPKREPTDDEIYQALAKAREEGNIKFEAQILDYMAERKANRIADARIKEIESRQEAERKQAEKQQSDWVSLNRDYVVYDDSGKPDYQNEMSLTNQNGLLYKTAMSLYQDKELQKEFYGDPDRIMGFRRAVADAYREIHQQGLYKPKESVVPQRSKKPVLADPSFEEGNEEIAPQARNLSDADKLREEIKQRRAYQNKRMLA